MSSRDVDGYTEYHEGLARRKRRDCLEAVLLLILLATLVLIAW